MELSYNAISGGAERRGGGERRSGAEKRGGAEKRSGGKILFASNISSFIKI